MTKYIKILIPEYYAEYTKRSLIRLLKRIHGISNLVTSENDEGCICEMQADNEVCVILSNLAEMDCFIIEEGI